MPSTMINHSDPTGKKKEKEKKSRESCSSPKPDRAWIIAYPHLSTLTSFPPPLSKAVLLLSRNPSRRDDLQLFQPKSTP